MLFGKKPNPCLPITLESRIFTFSFIIAFLKITLEPIEQLSPIETFCSIIVLCPIVQLAPIDTLLPTKTFFPYLILSLNFVSFIIEHVSSKKSLTEFG